MKDIQGWEGKYAITPDGRVWAHKRIVEAIRKDGKVVRKKWGGYWLATNTSKSGDWYISIALGRKRRKGYKVHRLVAQAFIPNPDSLSEVNHKNGIKTDNHVENLEWCTRSQNMQHASANGWMNPKRGTDNTNAKLSQEQVDEIRRRYKEEKTSHRKLALEYGVSFMTIGDVIRNKRYITKDISTLSRPKSDDS